MALGVQQLTTLARRATPIALNIYDQTSPPVDLFAQRLRITGQKTITLEWWEAFPTMVEWIGDRKAQELFKASLTVTNKPYEVTYKMDRMQVDLDSDNLLVTQPQQMGAAIAQAFINGQVENAIALLRTAATALSYDGQYFFDIDHTNPDSSTFSNIVDLSTVGYSRSSTGKPTVDEARRELNLAVQRLQANRLRKTTVIRASSMPMLTVVVHSIDTFLAYEQLRTEAFYIAGTNGAFLPNEWKGKFELVQDTTPTSGEEKMVDVLMGEPGGPMPLIFNEARGPQGIEFDETSMFSTRILYFGSDAIYGFAFGFPQAAVRIQE